MTDFPLLLGDFEFSGFEVPDSIPFGGEHKIVRHELIGGKRVIDMLGQAPPTIEWTGTFTGSSALDRARYVDGLRRDGKALSLTWSELAFTVVVSAFHADFRRANRIPYHITLETITDDTAPVSGIALPTIDGLISDDVTAAADLAADVNDPVLTGLMNSLAGSIASAGTLAVARNSVVAAVAGPLQAAHARVTALIATTGAGIRAAGIGPTALPALTSGVTTQGPLVELNGLLGRIGVNFGAATRGGTVVDVSGGTLFDVAVHQYGDARLWTALATANGLRDPVLPGPMTLVVPPNPVSTGGVLA